MELAITRRTVPAVLLLCLCGTAVGQEGDAVARKRIVCSTTQIADFVRQVVGDRCRVDCILSPGADPHVYRPTAGDARLVAAADLCLENGWHLEGKNWLRTLADDAGKPITACVEGIEPLLLEVEGEQVPVKDPHAWFSPRNAAVYVRNILRAVSRIEPGHAAEFQARAELYLRQLQTLDGWIAGQVRSISPPRRVLVTSHDAFNYFCRDYEFKSSAPAGWSTAAEVGAGVTAVSRRKTVDSIRESGVKAIFVETSVNKKLIYEIAAEAGVKIGGELYSDSMGASGTAGETYLGMMRENVLKIVAGLK